MLSFAVRQILCYFKELGNNGVDISLFPVEREGLEKRHAKQYGSCNCFNLLEALVNKSFPNNSLNFKSNS